MTTSWNAVDVELNAYGGMRRIYERYNPHISCRRYGRVFVRDEERVGD
jgi:hypothetical protein